ncbi:UMP kinase [Candidatus Micrarchaeota archaeon]|nr:UMP kinase [Candidatus Micrarchaeota archaeon]
MSKIVLSIGGSLLNPGKPDLPYIRQTCSLLEKLKKLHTIAIVTGGGSSARTYANAIRSLSNNEFIADEAGISSTKQNSYLLIACLKDSAYPKVPDTFEDAAHALLTGKIVVMGGTIPGITTDADASLLAEKINADRVINLSNVDAIYDSDPRKNKNAKKFPRLSFSELVELATSNDQRKAGTHFIFDLLGCKIIARSKIETHFVNGKNLTDVENAINGKKHNGTIVCD